MNLIKLTCITPLSDEVSDVFVDPKRIVRMRVVNGRTDIDLGDGEGFSFGVRESPEAIVGLARFGPHRIAPTAHLDVIEEILLAIIKVSSNTPVSADNRYVVGGQLDTNRILEDIEALRRDFERDVFENRQTGSNAPPHPTQDDG